MLPMLKEYRINTATQNEEMVLTDEEQARLQRNIAATDRLKYWMDSHGASVSKIEAKYFSRHYRGIVACNQANINELLLSVPKKLMITYEDAKSCLPVIKMSDLGILGKLK